MNEPPSIEENHPRVPERKPSWKPIAWLGAVLLSVLGVWLYLLLSETPAPARPPSPPPVDRNPATDSERKDRDEIYRREIEPLLKATEHANRQAAERALGRVTEKFDGYRGGIESFTEDITSIGTRFRILVRMPGDWWYEDKRIANFIQRKFEVHLFSEDQFHRDISGVLDALREDIEANQNRMLVGVRDAVESGDLPSMAVPDYRRYEEEIRAIILEFSSDRAKDSVYQGIATLILSEVAAVTVSAIVVKILTSVGTTAATSAAAGGGAAGAGAATGGAAGTLAGPVGTAIGIGVGLVIGAIVDWWMTEQFKERLSRDLDDYFQALQTGLLDGTETEAGLKASLDRFIDDLNYAQEVVLRRGVVGGP